MTWTVKFGQNALLPIFEMNLLKNYPSDWTGIAYMHSPMPDQ
jgi:hypothetical protein